MKKDVNVLIIDNRPIFIQNIRFLLSRYFIKKYKFNFYVKTEYTDAIEILEKFTKGDIHIHIIILNVDINYRNYFGLVLVKKYISKMKKYFPEVKIIISTSMNENYRINQIITKNNPFGIIMEDQTSESDLLKLFISVINYRVYYPNNIYEIIEQYKFDFFEINEIEFQILYLLKYGIKTNYLYHYIPRSNSTIEKIKSSLKDTLLLNNRSDEKLVEEAIKRGFLNEFEYCKNYSY